MTGVVNFSMIEVVNFSVDEHTTRAWTLALGRHALKSYGHLSPRATLIVGIVLVVVGLPLLVVGVLQRTGRL